MSRESEQGVSLEILNVKSDKANLGGGGGLRRFFKLLESFLQCE